MTLNIDTTLTFAQHERLSKIEAEDPNARVIDWDFQANGPKILHSDGRIRAINPHGRPLPRLLEEMEKVA